MVNEMKTIKKEFRGDVYPMIWGLYYRPKGYDVTVEEVMDQFLSGWFIGVTYCLEASK